MKVYDIISEATFDVAKLTQLPDGKWTWALPPDGSTKMGTFPSKEVAMKWGKENPDKFPRKIDKGPLPGVEKSDKTEPGKSDSTKTEPTKTEPEKKPKPEKKKRRFPGSRKERPSERLKQLARISQNPRFLDKWTENVLKKTELLRQTPLYKIAGRLTPVFLPAMEWIDDMEAIQIALDEGWLGDETVNADDEAKFLREDVSTIFVSKMISQKGALMALATAGPMVLRAFAPIFAAFPGAGWIAGLSAFAASIAIPYILQQENVQRWILENTFFAWLYPLGQLVGSGGGMVTKFLSGSKPFGIKTVGSTTPQDWKEINLAARNKVEAAIGVEPVDTLDLQRRAQQRKAERKAGIVPPNSGQPNSGFNRMPGTEPPAEVVPTTGDSSVSADDLLRQLK
jgi:hypothetical protein